MSVVLRKKEENQNQSQSTGKKQHLKKEFKQTKKKGSNN